MNAGPASGYFPGPARRFSWRHPAGVPYCSGGFPRPARRLAVRLSALLLLLSGVPAFGQPPGFGRREPTAPPPPVVRDVPDTPAAVRAAVGKAMPTLWLGMEGHNDVKSCFTCHNHGVPLLALAVARGRGYAVDADKFREQVEYVVEDLERNRGNFERGRGPGPPPAGGETDNTGYSLLALAAAGHKPDGLTALVAEYTLNFGKSRPQWSTPAGRVPTEASNFTVTALSLRGLAAFGTEAQKPRILQRTEGAKAWLIKSKAKDTEDRVFKLAGLSAAGAEAADVQAAAKELLATQREDGGWGQIETRPSDAYATGTALWALYTAGKLPAADPAYRKGVRFLLGTQEADGTWHVVTRSFVVQKYYETGFPHGKDQFISAAATGWAVAALALATPGKQP